MYTNICLTVLLTSCAIIAAGAPERNDEFRCPTSEGYFPHTENCRNYYLCQKNVAYLDLCAKGKLFDAIKRMCVNSKDATCASSLSTTPPQYTTAGEKFSCCVQNGNFPHEHNCQSYYECYNWLPYTRTCNSSQLFDDISRTCTDAENATCSGKPAASSTISEDNPSTTEIDYTAISDTTKLPSTARPTSKPTTSSTISEDDLSTIIDESTTKKPTTKWASTARPISKPTTTVGSDGDSGEGSDEFECPELDGLFPHPTDPHSYLHCQGGYPHILRCPGELIFDKNLKTCTWPAPK